MEIDMADDKPLLNKPEIEPTPEVLSDVLKESYNAFKELSKILIDKYNLDLHWKYYKDSKAWLCKVAHKKKTIFWLSAWDGYFKIGFYFLERHLEEISKLEMNENNFTVEKEWGKMIPIVFNIHNNKQFFDLLKIIAYKKNAK